MQHSALPGVNDSNLRFVAEAFGDLNYVAFYGTLLGLIRSGRTIVGDDDVDILVLDADREEIVRRFQSLGYDINLVDPPNNMSPHFMQVSRHSEFGVGFIDFYFVQSRGKHLVDSWSFWGAPRSAFLYLKIDRNWFYETDTVDLDGVGVKVPRDYQSVLHFLYGKNWRVEKQKGTDYVTVCVFGHPVQLQSTFALLGRTYNFLMRGISRWF